MTTRNKLYDDVSIVATVTTTGTAGSATGTATTPPFNGDIEVIQLTYDGTAPASTTVTITEVGGMGRTILTRSATATSGTFYPRVTEHDTSGTALVGSTTRFAMAGRQLQISVTNSNALAAAVTVRVGFFGEN